MKLGTVREIKRHEYRVGLTPDCVRAYVAAGHEVFVEAGAGLGAGFEDEQYRDAGGVLLADRREVFAGCEMVVKVKEPQPDEVELLREGQILFTYLHLAASRPLTEGLLARGVRAVAYETIEVAGGVLPCLKPMSEIAGRLATQEGARYLEKPFGGRGVLLGGVPGVAPARVTVLGGGVSGTNAAKIAVGMGAQVTILDIDPQRMAYLDDVFAMRVRTLFSTPANVEAMLAESDLVIGAVLIPGAKAPHLIRREQLTLMKKGAVIVDIAIDQGGCVETSRPHHPRRARLFRRRRDALLRGQHARRGRANLDAGADEFDLALRPADRQLRPDPGPGGVAPPSRGTESLRRAMRLPWRRRGVRDTVYALERYSGPLPVNQPDDIDWQIIRRLREQLVSNSELARDMNVSEGMIRRRIQRLRDAGIIALRAQINTEVLANQQLAVIGVSVAESRLLDEKARQIAALDDVLSVSIVSGRYDLLVEVLVDSNHGLVRFLTEELSTIAGISKTESFVLLKSYDKLV